MTAAAILCGGVSSASAHDERVVADDASKVCPLLAGAQVPDVHFTSLDGTKLELRSAVSQKPVILIFYRGGW